MSQPEAWTAYDRWRRDERVDFMEEPPGLEQRFRSLTRLHQPATKDWATAELTLVTFDRAFRTKVKPLVFLK